ncbi:MAG: glycosyltransferase family 2 protein [Actinomycetota bacterium]
MTTSAERSLSISPDPTDTDTAAAAVLAADASDSHVVRRDEGAKPYVTIVLPCYNEEGHVLAELERISAAMDASGYVYDLDVYDDCSSDGTRDILASAAKSGRFPRMRYLPRHRNGGSGTIRRIGSQNARGEIVAWTDADMTYPNERIPEFVQMLDADASYDQVVGARTSEEGTYKLLRVPAKWVIRKIASRLTGTQIPDLNSGLRVFRRDVAKPYLRLLPAGFSCVTTLTVSFLSNGHDVQYVPIDYAKRAGKSKFHFTKDAYRYILQVLRMVMYFNPLKVLMPIALWIMTLGVGKLAYDLIAHPFRITGSTVLALLTGFQIAALALLADLVVRSRNTN